MTWRWHEGTWLGVRFNSNEHVVAMDDGKVIRARAVESKPEEARWCAEKALGVEAMPWTTTGTVRIGHGQELVVPRQSEETIGGKTAAPTRRGMPAGPGHLSKFGYTEQCKKCRLMRCGDTSRPNLGHSEKCKERIRELCLRDAEFQARAQAGLKDEGSTTSASAGRGPGGSRRWRYDRCE